MEKSPRSRPWLPLLLGLVPVGTYFSFLAIYAVNVPLFDDHALRNFLVSYQAADSFAEKFALVFSQHNEHRIGYDRLVVLLQFWLTGEINFVGMMIIGNLSLIGILWIFYRIFAQTGRSLWAFVPVPYLLFSLALHENTFWGMAALQNFTVVFFVLLSLFHLARPGTRALLWACLSAVAAVYTSGNGFLLLPVGVGLLALQQRWRDLLIFSSVSAVFVTIYFVGYQPPPGNPDQIPLTELGRYARGFLLFLGAMADLRPQSASRYGPILLLGTLLLIYATVFAVLTILFFNRVRSEPRRRTVHLFLTALFAFVLVTALLVVYSRLSFGETVLLTSRYKIYSVLLAIGVYLTEFTTIPNRFTPWRLGLLGALPIAWNAWMIVTNLPEANAHRKEMLTNLFNWTYSENRVPTTDGYNRREYPYRRPLAFYSEFSPRWVAPIRTDPVTSRRPVRIDQTEKELIVQDSVRAPTGSIDDGVYLLFKSRTRTFLFPTRPSAHTSPRRLLATRSVYLDGYTASVPKADLPTDRYRLYLIRYERGQATLTATGEPFEVVSPKREGVKTNW